MFFFSSRRRHTRCLSDWSSDVCSSDLQVFKFSPEGKVLLTLGKAGVAGEGPDTFNGPADVVVAPNGDIFRSEERRVGKECRSRSLTRQYTNEQRENQHETSTHSIRRHR